MKAVVLGLTSSAVIFGWTSWVLLPTHQQPAFILLIIALTADLFDGYVARRWNITSRLGAWLDTLADIFLYLLFPLRYWQAHDHLPMMVFVLVLGAGLFRLIRFSLQGLKKTNSGLKYTGLPVYYLQIFLALTLIIQLPTIWLSTILALISILMVSRLPIPKTSVRSFVVGLVAYVVIIIITQYGG